MKKILILIVSLFVANQVSAMVNENAIAVDDIKPVFVYWQNLPAELQREVVQHLIVESTNSENCGLKDIVALNTVNQNFKEHFESIVQNKFFLDLLYHFEYSYIFKREGSYKTLPALLKAYLEQRKQKNPFKFNEVELRKELLKVINIYISGSNCCVRFKDDYLGSHALFVACKGKKLELVKGLIKAGADVNYQHACHPPIFSAVYSGNLQAVQELLKNGADVNYTNNNDDTVLIWACLYGHKEIAKELIKSGADLTSQFGKALASACKAGNIEIVNELYKINSSISNHLALGISNDPHSRNFWVECQITALIEASKYNRQELVKFLLEKLLQSPNTDNKAKLNLVDEDGRTALMYACLRGYSEIAELLLQAGADISFQSGRGSALHFAVKSRNKDIVNMLLREEINLDLLDSYGKTSLALASEIGVHEIVKILIAAKANLDLQNEYGETALMLSLKYAHKEVAITLIEAQADVNAKNKSGETALMYACKFKQKELVPKLLEAGADVNAQKNNGLTAIFYATEHKSKEVVQLLINAGADLTLQYAYLSPSKYSLLWYAHLFGAKEIEGLLKAAGTTS